MASTSSFPTARRRELSPVAAMLLAIGGNMLAIAIAAVGIVGIAVAAFAVFCGAILEAL